MVVRTFKSSILKALERGGYVLMRKPDYERLLSQAFDYQSENNKYHAYAGIEDVDPAFIPIYETCRSFTMTSSARMYALYKAIEYIIHANVAGDIVECGVWRGGSMMVIAHTLLSLKQDDRRLYLFDTFEGLPKPDEKRDVDIWGNRAIDRWMPHRKTDESSTWTCVSLDEVRANMATTCYPGHLVHYVKGMVEETLPANAPQRIALIRLDTDWYASTRHELEHLFHRLSHNGVIVIDDYGHFKGARQAVDEFIVEHKIPLLLNRIDYSGRIAIKNF
jgi:O-methyltransferase